MTKRLIVLLLLVFVSVMGWRIGERLSADALGMAVGIIFGIVASVPVAVLVLAVGRRSDGRREERGSTRAVAQRQVPAQPQVIVVAPPAMPMPPGGYYPQPGHGQQAALPYYGSTAQVPMPREFRIVGEQEEWDEGQ